MPKTRQGNILQSGDHLHQRMSKKQVFLKTLQLIPFDILQFPIVKLDLSKFQVDIVLKIF